MEAWLSTILLLLGVYCIRVELVYRIRVRRINESRDADYADTKLGIQVFGENSRIRKFEAVSFNAMLYDLTKWTYKQFYPNPA